MAKFSRGSVTKNYGKWVGLIWKTDDDGNRVRLTRVLRYPNGDGIPCEKKGNRNKYDAQKALTAWRDELVASDQAGNEQEGDGLKGVTVEQYLTGYLDGLESSNHIERSTLTGYRASARKISAGLGSVCVAELTTADIQAWEASLLNEEGLSNRSVTKHHRLLSQAMKAAVDAGDLKTNPCEGVKLPKVVRKQPHAMTKKQANDLLATLAAMQQSRVVSAARIALLTGLRVGEVCALTWADVDEDRGILRVNKAVGVGDGGAYIKTPKNGYSVRDVPLTPQLTEALEARRAQVVAEAGKLGVVPLPKQLSKLYIVGGIDGGFTTPNVVTREWKQLRDALGVTDADGHPLRFHDLRHTWATIAVQSGADIKSVSAIMGHADASMTLNIYASSDEQARRAAADRIAEFMGETPEHGKVKKFRATGTE